MPDYLDIPVAVIWRNSEVLVSRRVQDTSFGGYWEFPGGKVEAGESLETCLIREVDEELGVQVSVVAKRLETEYPYPDQPIRLHAFDCTVQSGQPEARQCAEFAWLHPDVLVVDKFPPASTPLIESIRKEPLQQ